MTSTTEPTTTALRIVEARIRERSESRPSLWDLYEEAACLWDEEMQACSTLYALGMRQAAECAWQRRTAARDLCRMLRDLMP